jgi:hypothetical protein
MRLRRVAQIAKDEGPNGFDTAPNFGATEHS